jgi:hypothetical protein
LCSRYTQCVLRSTHFTVIFALRARNVTRVLPCGMMFYHQSEGIMKADIRFLSQQKEFWANIRTISQELGYTVRGAGTIKVPALKDVKTKFKELHLDTHHICNEADELTDFGMTLFAYFDYRAKVLNEFVQSNLMNKEAAEIEFEKLKSSLNPTCPLPMNKQKAEKKNYAFLTGMVNMLIEQGLQGLPCDYDPRALTTITHNGQPVRTLSRRVDGAFPAVINPLAIWEIKEYYYTTTFGSRVADGVYETLLDGMELEELEQSTNRKVDHILIIDDYFTWWECGRSYLCRMIDMLHMGYVDEVIFGREVLTRLPSIVSNWKISYTNQS